MITLRGLCSAVRRSLAAAELIRSEEDRRLALKRLQQRQAEEAWQAELKRREEAELDADGSRAAARQALEEQRETARLASIAAGIARKQAKLSTRH